MDVMQRQTQAQTTKIGIPFVSGRVNHWQAADSCLWQDSIQRSSEHTKEVLRFAPSLSQMQMHDTGSAHDAAAVPAGSGGGNGNAYGMKGFLPWPRLSPRFACNTKAVSLAAD
ncbi:GL16477 [Drosophila persimilis]|uniref:GL16477 n=1 Tax=Drosophila persimilis TaxID=7234 RepID=B4GWB6_DROPE|nr:GL16477 [Drosophila persimilis]